MTNGKEVKAEIITRLQAMLSQKVEMVQNAIQSAKESRDSDTKSSMGDKYETGRAMMQMELEKSEVLLGKAVRQQKKLTGINLAKSFESVDFGSLVVTSMGIYFISIGVGKVEVGGENYFCVSLASPIGKVLQGQKVGGRVNFQGRDLVVKTVV